MTQAAPHSEIPVAAAQMGYRDRLRRGSDSLHRCTKGTSWPRHGTIRHSCRASADIPRPPFDKANAQRPQTPPLWVHLPPTGSQVRRLIRQTYARIAHSPVAPSGEPGTRRCCPFEDSLARPSASLLSCHHAATNRATSISELLQVSKQYATSASPTTARVQMHSVVSMQSER